MGLHWSPSFHLYDFSLTFDTFRFTPGLGEGDRLKLIWEWVSEDDVEDQIVYRTQAACEYRRQEYKCHFRGQAKNVCRHRPPQTGVLRCYPCSDLDIPPSQQGKGWIGLVISIGARYVPPSRYASSLCPVLVKTLSEGLLPRSSMGFRILY